MPTYRIVAKCQPKVDHELFGRFLNLERIPVTWKRSLHVGSNWRTHAD